MTSRNSSVFYGFLIAFTSVVIGMVIASRLDLAPESGAADLKIPATNSAPLGGPIDAMTFRTIAHDTAPSVVSIVTTISAREESTNFWEQFGLTPQQPSPRGARPAGPDGRGVAGRRSGFISRTRVILTTTCVEGRNLKWPGNCQQE